MNNKPGKYNESLGKEKSKKEYISGKAQQERFKEFNTNIGEDKTREEYNAGRDRQLKRAKTKEELLDVNSTTYADSEDDSKEFKLNDKLTKSECKELEVKLEEMKATKKQRAIQDGLDAMRYAALNMGKTEIGNGEIMTGTINATDYMHSAKTAKDDINKPNHYHAGGIDIYELMQAKYNVDQYRGFCLGNILKYTIRHELKGGLQDLKKAQFNMNRLIESHEGNKYIPEHKGDKI